MKLLNLKGCSVVIGDLQLSPEAKELVEKKTSPPIHFQKTDVTKWTELARLFTFTENELGAPDIVCPGAGKIKSPGFRGFPN